MAKLKVKQDGDKIEISKGGRVTCRARILEDGNFKIEKGNPAGCKKLIKKILKEG